MAEQQLDKAPPPSVFDLAKDQGWRSLPMSTAYEVFEDRAAKDEEFKRLAPDKHLRDAVFEEMRHGKRSQPTEPETPTATQGAPSPLQALGGFLKGEQSLSAPQDTSATSPEQLATAAAQQEPVTRHLGAFGAGVVGGAPGMVNIPGAVSHLVGGPEIPHVPVGPEDVAKATGFTPQTPTERIAMTAGEFMSPGAWLKVAGKLGLPPATVDMLSKWVSSGPRADVIQGAAAGTGGEIAAQAFPNSPYARPIGSMVGPAVTALAHKPLSAAAQFAGKPTLKEAEVTGAQTALEGAKQDLAETFKPLDEHLVDVAQNTRGVTGGLNPQAAQEVGESVQKALPAQERAVAHQAQMEGQQLVDSVGANLDRMKTLATARSSAQKFYDVGRATIGKLFDATEKVTGDAPMVSLDTLRSRADDLLAQARGATGKTASELSPTAAIAERVGGTGEALPAQTGALSKIGLDKDTVESLFRAGDIKLTPSQKQYLETFLASPDMETGLVPFWMARKIESRLSEVAYKGGAPIGSLSQGAVRYLLKGLQDDLHNFYLGAVGSQILPTLTKAKEKYKDFIDTVNRSIVGKLLSPDARTREQFLAPFTSSGPNTANLEAIKAALPQDTWNTLKTYTLAELHRKASASGQFDIGDMLTQLKGLRKSGKMDLLFEPGEIASIESYAQNLSAADTSVLPKFRAQLSKKAPSDVIDFAFSPGKLETTENYKAVTNTANFNNSVRTWARQLQERLPDMSHEQIKRELGPMVYRDAGAPSQLDLMLTASPGVSDKITDLVNSYRPKTQDVTTAEQALKDVKARYSIPEDIHFRGYGGMGGIHFRTGSVMTAGVLEALTALATGHPGFAALGGGLAGGALAFNTWAKTPQGLKVVKEGLTGHYAPSAVRWSLQALGGEPEEEKRILATP